MYEIIKNQYGSGKALIQSESYLKLKSPLHVSMPTDLFPLTQNYYHRLNPCFLSGLQSLETLKYQRLLTVRDGAIHLASFLLQHGPKLKDTQNYFLIEKSLAPIVPDYLRSSFAVWSLSKQMASSLNEIKKVIIYGSMIPQYTGPMAGVIEKLEILATLPKEVEVEVFVSMNKNPFEEQERGAMMLQELISHIKDFAGSRQLSFVTSEDFMERTSFKGCFLLDLMHDKMVIADSYLQYYVASKGGVVSALPIKNSGPFVFEMDLSFYHQMHVSPLPDGESIYPELLYCKKQSPGKTALTDSILHEILRQKLSQ